MKVCSIGAWSSCLALCAVGGRATSSQAAQGIEEGAGGDSAPSDASMRPLVVVIENTEAADMLSLQDLILVLSEVSPCIPISL